jgi:hypothetical protein
VIDLDDVCGADSQPHLGRAAGQHPHHRSPGQSRDQRAQRKSADPVGPLHIVDGEQQSVTGGQPLELIIDAIDEQERFTGYAGDSFELGGREKGRPPAAQQPDHRCARRGLLDFIAFASGDPDARVGGAIANLRQQSSLADPGIARDQDHAAGAVAGAPHDTERPCQRVLAAA